MIFRHSIVLAFLISIPFQILGDGLKVTLVLKRSEQPVSSGCNFVKEVTRIIYDEVMENRLKIWDSQNKELAFSAATIKSLEKTAGIKFVDLETIYMYETWTQAKKEVFTNTMGFYFAHKDQRGLETVFGFVDYAALNDLFSKTKINANASGNFNFTFESVIKSKVFHFQILQLGDRIMKTANEAQEAKISFVGDRTFNETALGYHPSEKQITYFIDQLSDDNDTRSLNSKRLGRLLEEFFIRNMEVYYNWGGSRVSSHLVRNKLKVTNIEVLEIWRKVGSEILYEPRNVVIYVNDSPLDEVNGKNISEFEFRYGETDLFGFLRTREFNFIITKINSESISRVESNHYLKGLTDGDWNKLHDFVIESQY